MTEPITKVIFLDFDGVIRVPLEPGLEAEFSLARMRLIQWLCYETGARVVISSDWRNTDNKEHILFCLSPCLDMFLHDDWATPVCGHRWNEVERWLSNHPEVTRYAILEDWVKHFEGAPDAMFDRLILCNAKVGLQNHHVAKMLSLLGKKDQP